MDIRVFSEVEKIWIIHNISNKQSIDFNAAVKYITQAAEPKLNKTEKELWMMFIGSDAQSETYISKGEMVEFLRSLFAE